MGESSHRFGLFLLLFVYLNKPLHVERVRQVRLSLLLKVQSLKRRQSRLLTQLKVIGSWWSMLMVNVCELSDVINRVLNHAYRLCKIALPLSSRPDSQLHGFRTLRPHLLRRSHHYRVWLFFECFNLVRSGDVCPVLHQLTILWAK